MKALLAEDNDLYREVLEMALIEAGYQVTSTMNGADALKAVRDNLGDFFDLIVTDYSMPLMSGSQLIHAMMAGEIAFNRIVLMSGSHDLKALKKEFAPYKGKIFVVSKDLTIAEMKETLFKLSFA